jgi:hypothetical protein
MAVSDNCDLTQQVFEGLEAAAPADWQELRLKAIGTGYGTDFSGTVVHRGSHESAFRLNRRITTPCAQLREQMYEVKRGTWYTAAFSIRSDGERSTQYDYESIPIHPQFNETLDDIRDSLMEDQERFPRDQEHLPEWHPARR